MVVANFAFEDLVLLVKIGVLKHKDSAVRKPEILHRQLILLIHLPPNKAWSIFPCLDPSGTQFPDFNTLNAEQVLSSLIDHEQT